ncbi:MAG: hypothetical protein PF505_10495, partial [Vallitaleaceae bacterium]|nr:hypothetical protein [Vallitaleaceae bacterium]
NMETKHKKMTNKRFTNKRLTNKRLTNKRMVHKWFSNRIIKKHFLFGMMLILIMGMSACTKNKENDQPLGVEEVLIDANDMVNDVDSLIEETLSDEPDSVTDDVYDEDTVVETSEMSIIIDDEVIKKANIDENTLSEIISMVDYAYYNYLWNPSTELDAIKQEDMQKFAISYIYQYEYNELFFDTNDFVLYIPDNLVTEMVRLFFDESFIIHKIDSDIVTYVDDNYLMPAVDGGQLYDPEITEILKTSDFVYTVKFKSSDPNIGIDQEKISYQIHLEEREGRLIYTSYKMIIEEPEEDVPDEVDDSGTSE